MRSCAAGSIARRGRVIVLRVDHRISVMPISDIMSSYDWAGSSLVLLRLPVAVGAQRACRRGTAATNRCQLAAMLYTSPTRAIAAASQCPQSHVV
jgi:hypothetical protein